MKKITGSLGRFLKFDKSCTRLEKKKENTNDQYQQ